MKDIQERLSDELNNDQSVIRDNIDNIDNIDSKR
jgi:hypothetical protein